TRSYGDWSSDVCSSDLLRQIEAPARKWLFIAAAPLAIDFTLGYVGIWNNTHFSRFATGALLGAVAVLYIMPGLIDLSLRDWGRRSEERRVGKECRRRRR